MAASLVVPTDRVLLHAAGISPELPPPEELARMSGEPLSALSEPRMLRKAAIKLLGGLVVDLLQPALAEHIQAMKGVKDARLHDYDFKDAKAAMKYRRDLVRSRGTEQLEMALR